MPMPVYTCLTATLSRNRRGSKLRVLKAKRLKAEKRAKLNLFEVLYMVPKQEKGDTRSNHRYGGSIVTEAPRTQNPSKLSRMTEPIELQKHLGFMGTVKSLSRVGPYRQGGKRSGRAKNRENYAAAMQALEEQKNCRGQN